MRDDAVEGETADTVAELFDRDDPRQQHGNPLDSLSTDDRRRAFDGFHQEQSRSASGLSASKTAHERKLAMWTVATVALALCASIMLGFVSIDSGAPLTAFGAGLLTGGSGLVLGIALVGDLFP